MTYFANFKFSGILFSRIVTNFCRPHVNSQNTAISLKPIANFLYPTSYEKRNLIFRNLFSINSALHTYFFFQCIVKSKFGKEGDKCIRHPKDCDKGLSLSIWEKVHF